MRWLSSLAFFGTGLDPDAARALAASATLVRLTAEALRAANRLLSALESDPPRLQRVLASAR